MPKLLLLDGHSLAYRAFYALPTDLATKSGTVTNAVYGFTSMLTKVMADEQPDHIAVAFDAPGGSTYRNELDSEYKAGRKETPDLFRSQLPLIHEVLEALEITQLEITGRRGRRRDRHARHPGRRPTGMDVVIVTGDRDSYQLVRDPHIKVLYNKRGVSDYALYDEAGIAERCLGVTPAQYLDYASLRGDTSDNLPGRARHRREDRGQAHHHLRRARRHLRAPRRAAAEAAHEPRRGQGPRLQEPRDVAARSATSTSTGSRRPTCSRARSTARRVRVLFNQLEFRLLLPRILDAVGDVAETPEADTLDVDVAIARDAKAAADALRAAAAKGERVAIEARWAGAVGRSAVTGLAISTGDDATYIDGDLLADADGARRARRDRRPEESAARRAPRQGADARPRARARSRSIATPR